MLFCQCNVIDMSSIPSSVYIVWRMVYVDKGSASRVMAVSAGGLSCDVCVLWVLVCEARAPRWLRV